MSAFGLRSEVPTRRLEVEAVWAMIAAWQADGAAANDEVHWMRRERRYTVEEVDGFEVRVEQGRRWM